MLDKFITPIKCALSALKDKGDVFTTPNTQARKNAQKDFGKDSRLEVLQITSSLSVANLKELVEAVRERCVDSGDDGEKVLKKYGVHDQCRQGVQQKDIAGNAQQVARSGAQVGLEI